MISATQRCLAAPARGDIAVPEAADVLPELPELGPEAADQARP